jgi:hypothetical protein
MCQQDSASNLPELPVYLESNPLETDSKTDVPSHTGNNNSSQDWEFTPDDMGIGCFSESPGETIQFNIQAVETSETEETLS